MNNKRVNTGITQVLYEDYPYAAECEATVLECRECIYRNGEKVETAYGIILDKTVFFPEGGGQPADEGWLEILRDRENAADVSADICHERTSQTEAVDGERIRILDVQKENGVILHYVSTPVAVNTKVKALLNWNLRYERMQNHSGEHLFCGLIYKLYGYENVGFHMSKDSVTVDVNGVLTAEDMERLERLANEGVDANADIVAVYPETFDEMEYRSKLELTEDIRVVIIDGYDACACCAPHVKTTAEIGLIKVTDYMSHRGGTRFTLKCGKWARSDYAMLQKEINCIMRLFSAKREECHLAAERVSGQLMAQQENIALLKKQITGLYGERLEETLLNHPKERVIFIFDEALDDVQMRTLVNEGVAKVNGVVAGFIGNDKAGYRYIIGKSEYAEWSDLRELAKEMNNKLNGRGGGSVKMIQGSLVAKRKEIEEFF